MTNIPSLLRCEGQNSLSQTLFDDLELNGLLSRHAIEIMCRPCGAGQIAARQELFRRMEDEAFLSRLQMFHVKLQAYEKMLSLRGRDEGVPAVLLRLRILAAYADIGDEAASFADGGELLASVAAYFEGQKEMRTRLREALEKAKKHSETWGTAILIVSEQCRMTVDTAPESYYARLTKAVEDCGLSLPDRGRGLDERLDPDLSRAITALYAEKVEAIEEILRPFDDLPLAELVQYKGEIGFFLEIRGLMERAKKSGYAVCYPRVSADRRCIIHGLRDAALLARECSVVANDTYFVPEESFFFVVGANGGGKTTYLRSVGAALLMFLSGCPVFAEDAVIYPYEKVFAHFPADERFSGVGRLDEERRRVTAMTEGADEDSFYLFNETFSGADDEKGCRLTRELACYMKEKRCAGLYVTHFRQAAEKDFPTLAAVVDAADSAIRTYRIRRETDDLSSYAADILRKYGLDEASLDKRRERS